MVVWLTELATRILESLGYPGLVLLMALESMVAPVPSEAVMPFAGFLIVQGRFGWFGAVAFSSLGTMIGSIIGYQMGQYGGYPLVQRYGKYLLLNQEHLDMTVRWFERRGEMTIFLARFIPVVRHFISIPAGVARMKFSKFCLFTLIGGTLWNSFLLWVGVALRERWQLVGKYTHQIDYVVVVLLVGFAGWWLWHQLQRRKKGV